MAVMQRHGGEVLQKCRERKAFSPEAVEVLEEFYDNFQRERPETARSKVPSKDAIAAIAEDLHEEPTRVRTWLCNRTYAVRTDLKEQSWRAKRYNLKVEIVVHDCLLRC
jgi:uncharacterized protein (DUF2342 family)